MHVLVKFFLLISLAIGCGYASLPVLMVLTCTVVLLAILASADKFYIMLKRLKWLFLVLIISYAIFIPGEYVRNCNSVICPSYEGITAGFQHVLSILVFIAGLCVLQAFTTRDAFIGGIYQLLKPLHIFHVNASQFAARIWLTLHYVESNPKQHVGRQERPALEDVLNTFMTSTQLEQDFSPKQIEIEVLPLKKIDYLTVLLMVLTWCLYLKYISVSN